MAKIIHKVKLNNKNNNVYLPTTSYIDYFKNNYTILYLEGGSKEHPVNITTNKEYIIYNPFPGYILHCKPEILIVDKWINPQWANWYDSGNYWADGIRAEQVNDEDIYIVTGNNCLLNPIVYKHGINGVGGNPLSNTAAKSAPFRLKVWKVGLVDLE